MFSVLPLWKKGRRRRFFSFSFLKWLPDTFSKTTGRPIFSRWPYKRPYKRRNTGGSITKNNRRVDFTKILYTSKQNIKEISQEMQLLERTQECEPKYDLSPYKRWNTGGSITKNYRCVDLTMMHICTKFEKIRQEMWPAERTHFHQNMTFDPIKD